MNKKNELKNDKKMTPKQTSKKNVKKEKKTDVIPLIDFGDLMTTEEVCEVFRIVKDTLYRWVENDTIPYYRINGKKILFNRKTISNWLSEKMVG